MDSDKDNTTDASSTQQHLANQRPFLGSLGPLLALIALGLLCLDLDYLTELLQ